MKEDDELTDQEWFANAADAASVALWKGVSGVYDDSELSLLSVYAVVTVLDRKSGSIRQNTLVGVRGERESEVQVKLPVEGELDR